MTRIEKKQRILHTAMEFLFPISTHPKNVEKGYLGYSLTKKNIAEFAYNLDINKFFERKDLNFNNLPKKYQSKIKEIINDIEKSVSSYSIEQACREAAHLEDEIDKEILKIKK